ncbi:MAG: cytidine deaminase [Flavobacteriales bacterium]|nr:cytidine deaminase [Flavobacteriales bacterium]
MRKEVQLESSFEEWSVGDLDVLEQDLLKAAHAACKNAYAPYSNFRVGSAVLLKSGRTVIGSNQENMAYPSGLCAERVAFFSAGAQFPGDDIVAAAVVTDVKMPLEHFSPCGGCRQVMVESELRQEESIRFLMQAGDSGVLVSPDVIRFLPLAFQLPAR